MQLGLHCKLPLLNCMLVFSFCGPSCYKATACVGALLVFLYAQHSLKALLQGACTLHATVPKETYESMSSCCQKI